MKKFFQKLKSDYKFKQAGPGQKLGENTQQNPAQSSSRTGASSNARAPRQHGLTAAQSQAAAAALERIEKSGARKAPTSVAARRARQEIENERKMRDEAELINSIREPDEVRLESAPILSVQGVYYECPISGQIVPKCRVWKNYSFHYYF